MFLMQNGIGCKTQVGAGGKRNIECEFRAPPVDGNMNGFESAVLMGDKSHISLESRSIGSFFA